MADSNLLASILSGQDPLAPQMAQGLQGAQLSATAASDPNSTYGPIGVLAKFLGASQGHDMLNNAVQNATQARIAARPELAQLLAQPDPYAAAAQGQHSPLALAGIMGGATPESVADARLKAAQGAFFGAKANQANAANAPMPPLFVPSTGAAALGQVGRPAPTLPGTGRYQQAEQSQEQAPGAAAGTPSPRAQVVQGLQNPQTRAAMLAQIKARIAAAQQAAAARVAQSQQGGAGGAAGP
jgi:hypothetical protein